MTQDIFVRTISNTTVTFLKPKTADIRLEDIFFHIARLPRFTCAMERHYTVGQHSLLVAEQMVGKVALVGLLHDGAEYVFNDLASPIVQCCPDYKRLRDQFQEEIYYRFLPESLYSDLLQIELQMKPIDQDMCATEQFRLKKQDPETCNGNIINSVYFPAMSVLEIELELHRKYHHYRRLADG